MATLQQTHGLPPEIFAEIRDAAQRVANGVRNPEIVRRPCERMDRLRDEIQQKHGNLDIGVPAIQELRDRA
jgi:hypothetical protein